jgi:hypothetical protein
MNNPFLTSDTITYYDEKINEEVVINILNISKYFKHIYCLCPLNKLDFINMEIFMNKTINKDILDNTISKMVLYKTNISILKNSIHYGNIIYCDKEYINNANLFGYELDDNVLILPIYNISFLDLQKYIDNINGQITFNNLYDILIINNYFGDNIKSESAKLKINGIINNLEESKYWELSYNCLPNITKLFDTRKFNFSIIRNPTNNILIHKLEHSPIKENYIDQIFNRKNYVDPSEIINKKGYKLYWKVWNSDYSNDSINKLFDNLDDTQKYFLFSNLCVSKKYCHLVINNEYIINMMTPTIHKYINLYNYLFGYAWVRFYFEETINRFKVKTTDMYIFDINTASKLPVFYFNHDTPHKNPYCPILVANKSLNAEFNVCGINNNTENNIDNRICNLEEFKEKMNIFISNNKNIDLLSNINFKELKIAITGSIMTACAQYKHPLTYVFNETTPYDINTDIATKRYFNEYYYDSDIDVMVMSKTIFEFLDITRQFHENIMLNCCHYLNAEPHHINYNLLRISYLFVTSEFIKEYICTKTITYEVIIKSLDLKPIINIFVPFAKKMHKLECQKKLENLSEKDKLGLMNKYPEIFVFDENNLVIKLKDSKGTTTMINPPSSPAEYSQEEIEMILNSNNNLDEEKINITIPMTDGLGYCDNFKVKINSPHLNHDFELFPIFKDDFMCTVANFHMPCVRAYYNGENVYMTPSFISAHMTFMNIDYKYFAGSKDPISIINKYRMRGFGCWLNKTELETYIKYNYEMPFWNNLFQINPLNKKSYSKCFGKLPITSRMFQPRKINDVLIKTTCVNYEKLLPIGNYILYSSRTLTEHEYNIKRFNSNNPININYINGDTGYIEPLQRNIINTMFDKINSKSSNELVEPIPQVVPQPINNIQVNQMQFGWMATVETQGTLQAQEALQVQVALEEAVNQAIVQAQAAADAQVVAQVAQAQAAVAIAQAAAAAQIAQAAQAEAADAAQAAAADAAQAAAADAAQAAAADAAQAAAADAAQAAAAEADNE